MFKKIFAVLLMLSFAGCGNLSPRHEQRINNQDGVIDEIKTNQNGIMAEIGKIKNDTAIQNSQLEKIQQGLANYQSIYENSGVQILSGPGGIYVSMLALVCITILMLHYRSQAKVQAKTANILAEQIAHNENEELTESVFKAAMYTEAEENILNLIKKHKS